MTQHELVHTGEKPYGCKYCNKRFTQNNSLRLHERVYHKDEKTYKTKENKTDNGIQEEVIPEQYITFSEDIVKSGKKNDTLSKSLVNSGTKIEQQNVDLNNNVGYIIFLA